MKRWFLSAALLFCTSMVSAIHAQTSNAGIMTVPAGTVIHVRTIDPIDENSHHCAGGLPKCIPERIMAAS